MAKAKMIYYRTASMCWRPHKGYIRSFDVNKLIRIKQKQKCTQLTFLNKNDEEYYRYCMESSDVIMDAVRRAHG